MLEYLHITKTCPFDSYLVNVHLQSFQKYILQFSAKLHFPTTYKYFPSCAFTVTFFYNSIPILHILTRCKNFIFKSILCYSIIFHSNYIVHDEQHVCNNFHYLKYLFYTIPVLYIGNLWYLEYSQKLWGHCLDPVAIKTYIFIYMKEFWLLKFYG